MTDENAISHQTIIQYWGPIEELLRERFPLSENTGSRLRELKRAIVNAKLLADLISLNRERNACMHPPYAPLSDIQKFRQLARQSLAGLRAQRADGDSTPLPARGRTNHIPRPRLEGETLPAQRTERQIGEMEPEFEIMLSICPKCGAKAVESDTEHFTRGGGYEHWGYETSICRACGWKQTTAF